jgi:hypothetical protein
MMLTGDRKLQVQPVFSGPAGEAEQEGYKQFAAVEIQAYATYNAAALGGTAGGEQPLLALYLYNNH